MIRDHRPYYLKKFDLKFRDWYVEHYLKPHFAYLGKGYTFMKPWHVHLFGSPITLGACANVIASHDYTIRMTVWPHEKGKGRISIGDYCLICPGVRVSAADEISIGDSCMLAGMAYITDCDWHDIYDRVTSMGKPEPVRIGNNVWIGDSVIVCKGVTIGDNSVIGAGSVVVRDVPPNCIAAGNPAKIVKHLEADKPTKTRGEWFSAPEWLEFQIEDLDRKMLDGNTILDWMRSLLFPVVGD